MNELKPGNPDDEQILPTLRMHYTDFESSYYNVEEHKDLKYLLDRGDKAEFQRRVQLRKDRKSYLAKQPQHITSYEEMQREEFLDMTNSDSKFERGLGKVGLIVSSIEQFFR